MSYQGNSTNDNEANRPLGFLKTVVSEASGNERNDSDKENDHSLLTISEEPAETSFGEQKVQGHFKQSVGLSMLGNTDSSTTAKDEEKDMWDDFYNEEDFKVKKDEPARSNGVFDTHNNVQTAIEVENERILGKVEEERERSQEDDYSDTFDSSVRDDDNQRDNEDGKEDGDNNGNKIKKRKRKRLFKRRPPPIITTTRNTGGSHPDLGRHDNNHLNNQRETMSESGDSGDRGRRLNRRKQVSRPRCAGPTPNGDVLQQKYQELEELVLKPLPNPAVYAKQTRQQMLRLQGLSNNYHASNHNYNHGNNQVVEGLPPPSGNPRQNQNHVIVEEIAEEGYSTIRTLQVVQGGTNSSNSTRHNRPQTAHHSRRPQAGQGQVRPASASAGRGRPASANNRLHDITDSSITSSQGTRGRGVHKNGGNRGRGGRSLSGSGKGCRSDSESKDHSSRDSRDSRDASSDNQSRSNSRSPNRVTQNTDTHLKYSSNPALRQWLKDKNKLLRQNKLAERKKKREERAEKQEIERKRQEYLQDSDKRVKEWMIRKRKEAWKKAKEDKKRAYKEDMEKSGQSQYAGQLRGHSIERPKSAPSHSDKKMFIPVIRPDGNQASNNEAKEPVNGEMPTPQPPTSKFVYKRPVSGRVRLMKLQQDRKEDTKRQEMRKKELEKLTEEEKSRKMRMSYDQWLLKKRQEDYGKRQLAAKQRALAKSDPELERIVPEMARKRIENLQRGKKRIQTNVASVDDTVNKSFGGGDFGEGEVGHVELSGEAPGLQVSGQKKSLGQRPSSAKPSLSNGPMNPQISRSPRRPKSAHPRVQSIMDASEDEERVVDAKAFQLPFPPELGVPKYVAQRQEKLFSGQVIESASQNISSDSKDAMPDESIESQKQLADVQQDKTANTATTSKSDQVHQDATSTENEDVQQNIETEDAGNDPSFFMTDGNIDIIEKMEAEESEAVLHETLDDKETETEEREESIESQRDDIKLEADGDVDGAEMEYEEEGSEEENKNNKSEAEQEDINERQEENVPIDKETEEDMTLYGIHDEDNDESSQAHSEQGTYQYQDTYVSEEQNSNIGKIQIEPEEQKSHSPDAAAEEANEENVKEEKEEEEEPKSEASEGKSSIKRVSFVEEAVIHEDPLAGIQPEDYDTDNEDEAEDERGDFFNEESPRPDEEFWDGAEEDFEDDDSLDLL